MLDRNTFPLLLSKSYLIRSILMLSFLFWETFICTVPYRLFSCIVANFFPFVHLLWISYLSTSFNGMALNSLHCAEVPLRNCSLTTVRYTTNQRFNCVISHFLWRSLFKWTTCIAGNKAQERSSFTETSEASASSSEERNVSADSNIMMVHVLILIILT